MKECSDCKRVYDVVALTCEFCRTPLEDSVYAYVCGVGGVAAFVLQGLLYFSGVYRDGFWVEAFINATVFIILAYTATKSIQKARQPDRRILREIESTLSTRSYRLFFIALLLFVVFHISAPVAVIAVAVQKIEETRQGFHGIYGAFQGARLVILLWVPLLVAILLIRQQGLRFFDIKQPNSSVNPRDREEESPTSVFILQENYSQSFRRLARLLPSLGFQATSDPKTGRFRTSRILCASAYCDASPRLNEDAETRSYVVRLKAELRALDDDALTLLTIRPLFLAVTTTDSATTTFPCRSKGLLEASIFRAMRSSPENLSFQRQTRRES